MNARNALSLASVWLLATGNAFAGMTVVTLTDVAAVRIDALSFFLVTYLLISWVVKGIWNQLAKSFASLPILKYRQALGVLFVISFIVPGVLVQWEMLRETAWVEVR